jgi:lipase chaperone LimK
MEYLVTLNLRIFSSSNKPAFVFNNMKELIDLEVRNLVNDLHVSDETSLSDA